MKKYLILGILPYCCYGAFFLMFLGGFYIASGACLFGGLAAALIHCIFSLTGPQRQCERELTGEELSELQKLIRELE